MPALLSVLVATVFAQTSSLTLNVTRFATSTLTAVVAVLVAVDPSSGYNSTIVRDAFVGVAFRDAAEFGIDSDGDADLDEDLADLAEVGVLKENG